MGAQIMQQGTGINVALFYAPTMCVHSRLSVEERWLTILAFRMF